MAHLQKAFGYQGDNLNLPVGDVRRAIPFYETVLGFTVVSREDEPHKSALLTRDDVQIRLAENGGDPTQDGVAFHVSDVESLFAEFQSRGLAREKADFSLEKHGGGAFKVFYVVAPDGLCYWFGERQPG